MKTSNTHIRFTEYDLDNGMHVILSPTDDQAIVAVNLWYHVGSKDEDPSRTGFAHLFEHLMFQGSANVGKTEHFRYVQDAGGILNATTSSDRTNYFEKLPSHQLEMALWLESDRMLTLDVSAQNFENQRSVVKEERRQRYDNQPYGRTYETILKHLFPGCGYAWATIGSMQHLDETTLSEVQAFHKKWYVPNNASLTISGNFKIETATELIEKYFGGIPRGHLPTRPLQEITLPQGNIRLSMEDAVPLPAVAIAFQSPKIFSDDDYAMDILCNILSSGRSSRLYKQLVYEAQLAKSISAYNISLEKAGVLLLSATAQPGVSTQKLEETIWEELRRIQSEGVTAAELQKAKNRHEVALASGLQEVSKKADSLQQAYTFTKRTQTVNEVQSRLARIISDDIQRVAGKYLLTDHCVTLYTNPTGSADSTKKT